MISPRGLSWLKQFVFCFVYFSNFDSNTKFAVVDNSVDVNTWNCLKNFVNIKLFDENDMSEKVKTIRNGVAPIDFGDVSMIIIDNDQVEHQSVYKNDYYFPDSEINITSISELATIFPDEWGKPYEAGTYNKSSGSKSALTWHHGKSGRTFLHPDTKIPKMPINHGYHWKPNSKEI